MVTLSHMMTPLLKNFFYFYLCINFSINTFIISSVAKNSFLLGLVIPLSKSEDHYPNSMDKLSKLYFLSDRAISLKQGFKNSIEHKKW